MMKKRKNGLVNWLLVRFPLAEFWEEHMARYYAPKNFNFWYFFGSLALLLLVIQIVTGIALTMNYKPDALTAFDSVEYIMRDVNWGWLIRYMHSTGASAFFIVAYLHLFRGVMYGSYKEPRELVWILGMLIFLCLMAESFMGYLLPWGQMSYWGAQVIISLFSAIPIYGEEIALWIRGDYVVSDATLNRFFAFHVIGIPLVLVLLVFLHIVALHRVGSNNPDGIEIKKHADANGIPLDGIPFHPYYTVKDTVGIAVFTLFFAAVVFYMPELGGYFLEKSNFIPADPLATPEHIAPVWYFTPFYAILRAIPDKFAGVLAMWGSIFVLFLLPWLDRIQVKSIRYRGGINRQALALFAISFLALGYLGAQPATQTAIFFARFFTATYFAFFLLMPVYTRWEKVKPVPGRVTMPASLEQTAKRLWPRIKQTAGEITKKKSIATKAGKTVHVVVPDWDGIFRVAKQMVKRLSRNLIGYFK